MRIAAAEGLLNLGRSELALPVFEQSLQQPQHIARARAAVVLDSRPHREVAPLRSLVPILQRVQSEYPGEGYDWQFWYPMERAVDVIRGHANYYRWEQ